MSDPKSPDDAPPPGEAPGRPGRTAPFSKPPPAAFVVPYESIDEDVPPPPAASVIVRQSYANEVPPVVARPQKQPGEDDPTTRVEVIADASLEEGETARMPAADGPQAAGVPVVTDADLEDEEARTGRPPDDAGPAVIIDGPSEAYAPRDADRCPYCLTFTGLSHARSRGVRYCPMCGADWASLDREVEAPSGAVIPLGEELPTVEDDVEDHPTNEFTRLGPTRPAPGEPGFVPPPPPPRRSANPWLMLLTGVSLGLAGTMTVAWLYSRRQPPPPTVVSEPPPPTRVSPPVVQTPVAVDPEEADPPPARPEARTPEKIAAAPTPPPPEPKPPKPTPVEPDPPDPTPPEPTPPEPTRPPVSPDSVQAALIDATSLLPPRALVDIRPRIDGDIVFLTGVVDGTETLSQIVAAVAAVQGVRAVDSRGVRPAWKQYTVVKGDSLSRIAQLYYGDTNAWPRIFRANQDIVKTPGALHPGMKLRIPMNTP